MSGGVNVHITHIPFKNQARIWKETKSLADLNVFKKISVVSLEKERPSKIIENIEHLEIFRVYLKSREIKNIFFRRLFAYPEFIWRVYQQFKNEKVACINAHSLLTLPLASALKWRTGAELIYDTHELETETSGLSSVTKVFARLLETLFVRSAKAIFVVSQSIAGAYHRMYPAIPVFVVRNIPRKSQFSPGTSARLKSMLGLTAETLLFLYQGGLEPKRGIEVTLQAFETVSSDRHLVFLGDGSLNHLVQNHVLRFKNIHHLPAVPYKDLAEFTKGADVGLVLYDDVCLNHKYCLPNKIFEYCLTGLPAIVTPLLELKQLIHQYQMGWVLPNRSNELSNFINLVNREEIARVRVNMLKASRDLSWEQEEEVIKVFYGDLFGAEDRRVNTG